MGLGAFAPPILSRARLAALAASLPIPHPAAWTQALWVVDPVAGDDANPGTLAEPVKTVEGGIVAKWGTSSPLLDQTTTIRFVADSTEVYFLDPVMLGPFNFVIETSMALVATFAAGAVVAKNRATGAQFSVAGFPGSALAEMIVVNVTRGGTRARIRSNIAGVALLTQPLADYAPGNALFWGAPADVPAEDDGWIAGNTLQVWRPLDVGFPILNVSCGVSDAAITASGLWLKGARVIDPSGVPESSLFQPTVAGGYVAIADSTIAPYMIGEGTLQTNIVNTTTTGIEGNHLEMLGGHDIGGVVCFHGCRLDGDFIPELSASVTGSDIVMGFLHVPAGATFFVLPSSAARIMTTFYGTAPIVWGAGTLRPEANAVVWNASGNTWAATVFTGLSLNGDATGTSYAAGVWTDGVGLTAALLDANNGALQNPRSRALFTTGV